MSRRSFILAVVGGAGWLIVLIAFAGLSGSTRIAIGILGLLIAGVPPAAIFLEARRARVRGGTRSGAKP